MDDEKRVALQEKLRELASDADRIKNYERDNSRGVIQFFGGLTDNEMISLPQWKAAIRANVRAIARQLMEDRDAQELETAVCSWDCSTELAGVEQAATASIDDLRLAEHAALQLLERITERKERNANQESAPAMQSGDAQSSSEAAPTADADEQLAELFDPVRRETLEAMFPDSKKWAKHCERAPRNGLKAARVGHGTFNPYRAARWWLERQAPAGWDWARCIRVLAKNLPPRSRDSKHLLTGDYD